MYKTLLWIVLILATYFDCLKNLIIISYIILFKQWIQRVKRTNVIHNKQLFVFRFNVTNFTFKITINQCIPCWNGFPYHTECLFFELGTFILSFVITLDNVTTWERYNPLSQSQSDEKSRPCRLRLPPRGPIPGNQRPSLFR